MKRYTKYFFLCLYLCIFPPTCAMENEYGYEILSKAWRGLSTTFVCGTKCILFSFLYLYEEINRYNYRNPMLSQYAQNPDNPDNDKNTPLGNAIEKYPYNLTYVENLLKLRANPNIESGLCRSKPLTLAIGLDPHPKINPIKLIKLLVEYNAEINYFDVCGRTPLSHATEKNNLEVVRYFLDCNAQPNANPKRNKPPLIYACQNGNLDIVILLLNKKADINIASIENFGNSIAFEHSSKITPLSTAIQYKHDKTTKYLLENDADPNNPSEGDKPLELASKNGNLEIVTLLLEKNADVNARNGTPLCVAAEANNFQIVQCLLDNGAKPSWHPYVKSPLIFAAQNNNKEIIALLLEKNANINACYNSTTPLSAAAKNNNLELVQYLFENGAAVSNEYALKDAVINNNLDIINLLIEKNAAVYCCEGPLNIAIDKNNLPIVQYLLKFKNPDQKLGNALVTAVRNENFDMIKLLVKNNADVNDSGTYNFNALYSAIERGKLGITKYLLENGANPNTFSSKIPLNFAIEKNNFDIVKLLIQHKADVKQSTHPLRLAFNNNSLEIVQLLCNAASLKTPSFGTIFNLLPSHCNTKKNLTKYCTTIMTHAHFDQELTTTRGIELLVTLRKQFPHLPKEWSLVLLKTLYIQENYDNLAASTQFADFVKELYKELDVITYRNPIFTQVYKHITELKKILQIKTKTNKTALDELQDYEFHLDEQIKQLFNGTKLDNDFEKLKKALTDISNSDPTKTPADLIAPLSAKLDPDNLAFQIYKNYALLEKN